MIARWLWKWSIVSMMLAHMAWTAVVDVFRRSKS